MRARARVSWRCGWSGGGVCDGFGSDAVGGGEAATTTTTTAKKSGMLEVVRGCGWMCNDMGGGGLYTSSLAVAL